MAPGPIRPVDHLIEPDLSNAAPFLALAAVAGVSVTVRDWPRQTTQAGDALRPLRGLVGHHAERGELVPPADLERVDPGRRPDLRVGQAPRLLDQLPKPRELRAVEAKPGARGQRG